MPRHALALAAALFVAACFDDPPPVSVENQSEAMMRNLEERANALEMQADNAADAEVREAMRDAPALDAPADITNTN